MNYTDETIQTWNKLAELYWEKFSNIHIYDHTYDSFLAELIQQNAKVLDLGCGPGIISSYIKSKRKDLVITGVDASPNMIIKAEKMVPGLKGRVMKMQEINQIYDSFEGIICGFGLPYLSVREVKDCIQNCCSLLKQEGILYLSFVEGNPEESGMITGSTGDRTLFYNHKITNVQTLLLDAGFSDFKIWQILYPIEGMEPQLHIVILCKKM